MSVVVWLGLIFVSAGGAMIFAVAAYRERKWRETYDALGTTGFCDLDMKFADQDATRNYYEWLLQLKRDS